MNGHEADHADEVAVKGICVERQETVALYQYNACPREMRNWIFIFFDQLLLDRTKRQAHHNIALYKDEKYQRRQQ